MRPNYHSNYGQQRFPVHQPGNQVVSGQPAWGTGYNANYHTGNTAFPQNSGGHNGYNSMPQRGGVSRSGGFQQRGGFHSGNHNVPKGQQGVQGSGYRSNPPPNQTSNYGMQTNFQQSWTTGSNYNAPNYDWNSNYNNQNSRKYSNDFTSHTNPGYQPTIEYNNNPTRETCVPQSGSANYGEKKNFTQPFHNKPGFNRGNGHRGRGFQHQPPQHNHGQGNGGNQNQKKKQKVDKRELPENNRFFCDTCDRGFPTEEKYTTHTNEHQKCRHEGCSYVAAPKLVQLHIRLQHAGGMAKKIWSLESEEDIQKWKEERRKNFPTAENIARKNTMIEEKKARGEVLQTKYFGKMKGKQYNQQNLDNYGDEGDGPPKRKDRSKRRRNRKRKNFNEQATEEADGSGAKIAKLDDKSEVAGDVSLSKDGELGGTKTDGENLELTGVDNQKNDGTRSENKNEITDVGIPSDKIGKEKESPKIENKTEWKQKRRNQGKDNNNRPVRQFKVRRPPSLLEKLLANDIRHERNVILQCVHYIVKKNFFGIGQSSPEPSGTCIDSASNTETEPKQQIANRTD